MPSLAGTITSGDVAPGDLKSGVTVGGPGKGTVEINNGDTVVTSPSTQGGPFVNVAPVAGSNGSVTVGDAGSTWRVEGSTSSDSAFFTVGRGGTGTLDIQGGGRVELDALGADADRTGSKTFPAGFQLGRNASGDGTLRITGSSSELSVSSAFGTGFVGREGTGEMYVEDGGKLSFSGINTDLNVASDLDTTSSGRGLLEVRSGGTVEGVTFIDVGGQPGSKGTLNVDGPGSSITLTGECPPSNCPASFSFPNQGAFLTLGANRGTGVANVTNGGKILIDSSAASGSNSPGFNLGANSILGPEGDGTFTVDGSGSEVRVRGPKGFFSVGRLENGSGRLDILNGGQVIMENGDGLSSGFVGDRPGATGSVVIDGPNSVLDVGDFFGIGVDSSNISQAAGDGSVTLRNGATLKADTIFVENGGVLAGNGTVERSTFMPTGGNTPKPKGVDVIIDRGGTIDPGLSTGELEIFGDLILDEGSRMSLEVDGPNDFDRITATGDIILDGGIIDIVLGFSPVAIININDLLLDTNGLLSGEAAGDSSLFNVLSTPPAGLANGTPVAFSLNDSTFQSRVTSVPAPSTGFQLAGGLFALFLTVVYRQRSQHSHGAKQ